MADIRTTPGGGMEAIGFGGSWETVPKAAQQEIERLRNAFTWVLRHTSGKELRRMVGDLHDTSDLGEFIRAIERAKSK